MTPDNSSELAALWNATCDPEEQAEVARIARRTPRHARMVQAGELALVAVLAGVIVAAVVWRLGPATLLTGGLILGLLAWSAWKRHRLAARAMLVDGSDTFTFINTLLRATEAELTRSAIGLALMLPGTVLALLLGYLLQADGAGQELSAFIPEALQSRRGLASLVYLTCATLLLSLSHLRLVRELARLRQLRDDYAAEQERDADQLA